MDVSIEQALKDFQNKGFQFTFFSEGGVVVHWFGKYIPEANTFEDSQTNVYAPTEEWTFFDMFATLDLWYETHKGGNKC